MRYVSLSPVYQYIFDLIDLQAIRDGEMQGVLAELFVSAREKSSFTAKL
jgi:hypothetical protein